MLTSDKPVYQPGQVIHVRSLALARPDPSRSPARGGPGGRLLRDRPQGERDLPPSGTSPADSASPRPIARWPTEILEGAYQIRCELGDTTSRLTGRGQEVRPAEVQDRRVELDQPYYQPGQKVHGTLSARYFFGKPVADAEVEVRSWPRTSRRPRTYRATVQDRRGRRPPEFEFALPQSLVGRPQDCGRRPIAVTATVRDAAGQKQCQDRLAHRHRAADPHRGHPRGGHAGARAGERRLFPHDLCRRPARPRRGSPSAVSHQRDARPTTMGVAAIESSSRPSRLGPGASARDGRRRAKAAAAR